MKRIRRYLIAGLLVWLPISVTVFIFRFLVRQLDKNLALLPAQYHPATYGLEIPGLGVILTVLILLLTGLLMTNLVGRQLVELSERVLHKIPFIRTVYSASKNFAEVVFSPTGESFKRVMMIQYPRKGVWSFAFQTSTELGEVAAKTGVDLVCAFVPTTPNPTSGFIIMVPREEAVFLEMDVESALKMIISLGVVVPKWNPGEPLPTVDTVASDADKT